MRINAHQDNVAGVKIPRFERVMTGASDTKMHLTGLGKGGQQVQQCRKVRRRGGPVRCCGAVVLMPWWFAGACCAWRAAQAHQAHEQSACWLSGLHRKLLRLHAAEVRASSTCAADTGVHDGSGDAGWSWPARNPKP